MSLYDCRQIGLYPTTLPLKCAFLDKAAAMEGHDGVLSVSIAHCFPYADVPELSGRVLVITDNDKDKVARLTRAIGGVRAALISNRTRAPGLELFRNLGIDPTEQKLPLVKSTNHFKAAFGPVVAKVIYVDSDGSLSRDYVKIPYTRVQRPIRPLDAETTPGLIA
jgi:microcystin degradation protein MlrC